MTTLQLDLNAVLLRDPGRPALVGEDGVEVTFGEVIERANAFNSEIGTSRKLVFLEASNTVEAICAYVGCLIGGHPVYIYASHGDDVVHALAARYRPDLFLRPTRTDAIEWLSAGERRDFHPNLAVLLSTSGTTGSPKFVKLSRKNIVSNAESIAEYLGITVQDRAITSLSFAYSYGMSVVNSHLFTGASLLLNERPLTDPQFWEMMRTHEATSFAGVPYSFEVLAIADPGWAEVPSLRYVTQAGGRLDPDKVQHFARLGELHDWRFFVMYGQTECAPRIAYLPAEMAATYPGCIGVPIPGGRIDLVDEQGHLVHEADTSGELVYGGPNVMMGYADGEAGLATDETALHHRTGDLACRNADGLYYIVGRLKRFVKPFGLRVNLDELQSTMRTTFPNVACAGDDSVIVVARLDDPNSDDVEMTDWLVAQLKLPSSTFRIVRVATMPLLANGKIDYRSITTLAKDWPQVTDAAIIGVARGIFSLDFIKQVFLEAGHVLGFQTQQWQGVRQIYGTLLNARQIEGDDTFVGLAGDSLSYVQTSIALQQYLGHLPAGWENLSVNQLEQEGPIEQPF